MTTKKQVITFLENKKQNRIIEIENDLNKIYGKRIEENRKDVEKQLSKIVELQNKIVALNNKDNKFTNHYFSSFTPMSHYLNINLIWERWNSETGKIEIRENGIQDYLREKSEYHSTKDDSQKLLKNLYFVSDEWDSLIKQMKQFSSAKEMIKVLAINGIEYEESKENINNLPQILIINKENL